MRDCAFVYYFNLLLFSFHVCLHVENTRFPRTSGGDWQEGISSGSKSKGRGEQGGRWSWMEPAGRWRRSRSAGQWILMQMPTVIYNWLIESNAIVQLTQLVAQKGQPHGEEQEAGHWP